MGHPRKKGAHLPKCVYFQHGAYWDVKGGEWTRLPAEGPSTLQSAREAYAAIILTPVGTMPKAIDDALEWLRKRKPRLSNDPLKQYDDAAKILKRKLVLRTTGRRVNAQQRIELSHLFEEGIRFPKRAADPPLPAR